MLERRQPLFAAIRPARMSFFDARILFTHLQLHRQSVLGARRKSFRLCF